jgi:hypothetical protein
MRWRISVGGRAADEGPLRYCMALDSSRDRLSSFGGRLETTRTRVRPNAAEAEIGPPQSADTTLAWLAW